MLPSIEKVKQINAIVTAWITSFITSYPLRYDCLTVIMFLFHYCCTRARVHRLHRLGELSKRINHSSRLEFRVKFWMRQRGWGGFWKGDKRGATGPFLLRSINGAVIRECINNFGIINSRIIPEERSWPATLPAALPRKHGYALCRIWLCPRGISWILTTQWFLERYLKEW